MQWPSLPWFVSRTRWLSLVAVWLRLRCRSRSTCGRRRASNQCEESWREFDAAKTNARRTPRWRRAIQKGTWQHHLLQRWIAAGAKTVAEDEAEIVGLTIEPREIVFVRQGDKVRLKIIAEWTDGTREDVTPLCRFRSNDESLAEIDQNGVVTALGPGHCRGCFLRQWRIAIASGATGECNDECQLP